MQQKQLKIIDYNEVVKVRLSKLEQVNIILLTLFIVPFEFAFQCIRMMLILLGSPNRIMDRLTLHFKINKHMKANP